MVQETKKWIRDEKSIFLEKLNEKFEITNNPNDYVESSKIIDYLIKECNLHMSSIKIGITLAKLIKVEPRDKIILKKRCRLGIKKISDSICLYFYIIFNFIFIIFLIYL